MAQYALSHKKMQQLFYTLPFSALSNYADDMHGIDKGFSNSNIRLIYKARKISNSIFIISFCHKIYYHLVSNIIIIIIVVGTNDIIPRWFTVHRNEYDTYTP